MLLLVVIVGPPGAEWLSLRSEVRRGDQLPSAITSSARVAWSWTRIGASPTRRENALRRAAVPPCRLMLKALAKRLAAIHIRTGMTVTSDVRAAPRGPLVFHWAAAVSRLLLSIPQSLYNRLLYCVNRRSVKFSSSRGELRDGRDQPRRHGATDAVCRLEARLVALDHPRHGKFRQPG
jgi:hypothetical protein